MSWSAIIILAVVADGFHFPLWKTGGIFVVYVLGVFVDRREKREFRDAVFVEELFNWDVDADAPEYENKGNLTRIRLTGQNQIIVERVGELLRRIL
jgi:hypothetical protein